jgi:cob(I)alamin adenosyltransferase
MLVSMTHNGLIHIYTGDGKGKTTCAVGLAVRAKSRDYRVLFAQFMKTIKGGETDMLVRLDIEVQRFERVLSPLFHPNADLKRLRERALEALEELRNRNDGLDMLILDEFIHLLNQNLLTEDEVKEFLASRPRNLHVVLTGRGAPQWLIEIADQVTEMRDIKHHAIKGIKAHKGIEY